MAGRGRGRNRRGQHNAEPELPPPPTMAQVLNNIETNRLRNEQLLERVAQNTERRPDNCVTLGDFIRALPPVFTHPKEPLDADDWLRTIERKFNALHVPPGERVNFATYQLEGAAGSWWEGFLALQAPGHDVTWEEFVTAFRAAYIPKTVMDIKRREFLDFTQGKLDVETYGREFTQLSRYAPRDVVDDADKQDLFRKGLNPELRYEMLPFTFQSFQDLHNRALRWRTEERIWKNPRGVKKVILVRLPLTTRSAVSGSLTVLYLVLPMHQGLLAITLSHHLVVQAIVLPWVLCLVVPATLVVSLATTQRSAPRSLLVVDILSLRRMTNIPPLVVLV
ncbi:hypothetical protein QYE76_049361 [Lolium multiflorum]|uniref:Retrotransposon gag domain-containing protein n=1 Tax=Lolium multiflorum TaxID=4521 RepID=A0AAD8SPI5_LOLMU|nr:hypothetical protein QYE76_049361 [Lolium multiflorum]